MSFKLGDCNPSLRERIKRQLESDLIEFERRSSKTDGNVKLYRNLCLIAEWNDEIKVGTVERPCGNKDVFYNFDEWEARAREAQPQ
jgi:hypothetical protein